MSLRIWLLLLMASQYRVSAARAASTVPAPPASSTCFDISTKTARFDILRSGYIRAQILTSGRMLSLDHPNETSRTTIVVNGREIRDFELNCAEVRASAASGRLGANGRKFEVTARSKSLPQLEERLVYEEYENLPHVIITTADWRNSGNTDLTIANTTFQVQRLDAAQADRAVRPYRMWSFQGASEEWGKDDVLPLSPGFSRENVMQQLTFTDKGAGGAGGGIPVVAFWTRDVGEAIGQVDRLPMKLSLPVRVVSDERVIAGVSVNEPQTLHAGETYSLPTTFLAIYHGDYFEPLRLYSEILKRQGWAPAHPTGADYQANWCGWGYQQNFTPAQIIGTIPKIKELGIRWATLDAGWYDNRGDWNARADMGTKGIRGIVDAFHKAGLKLTLWWIPLAVEDGGKDVLDGEQYKFSAIAHQHPEWLILDKDGKRARMAGHFATLCPAVPGVRNYYREITRRFIREWGFDGNKLDFSYTVPACYNPAHHHQSPQDSIRAVEDVYRAIFQTTCALKPESVTQICPCGTTPNLAWLDDYDQAVTADPVGSVQVRRRIKMYKALLGPQFPVYGDHVELTRIIFHGSDEKDWGRDFASTVGTGGVVGTKFNWPEDRPAFRDVALTPEKEALWKKWLAIYNKQMLSEGTFRNLYVYGYDSPEGYAIEKDGRMYYAFFRDDHRSGQLRLELRGLGPGRFHVFDYETGRDYGTVNGSQPVLSAAFSEHLLLQVSRDQRP